MGEVRITDEMVEAARAKGRELAGNQPGALVEAMAEIAEQGARAALSAALSGMAEPVAWYCKRGDTPWTATSVLGLAKLFRDATDGIALPLYTVPPSVEQEELDRLRAENERLHALVRWAHETLQEINPSNYSHDDVCNLNDASVEVILGLAPTLGERHGKSDEWWAARTALQTEGK